MFWESAGLVFLGFSVLTIYWVGVFKICWAIGEKWNGTVGFTLWMIGGPGVTIALIGGLAAMRAS